MASVASIPRARPYPVMANSSLDYLPEHAYGTQHSRTESHGESFIIVSHEVSPGNLVAKLISEGKAAFACTLTSAHSAYREVFVENGAKGLKHDQKLVWDKQKAVSPLLFQPAVVVLQEVKNVRLSGSDGLLDIWHGSEVSFPKGSMLATAPFWRSEGTLQSILRIRKDEELPKGCYEVQEVEEQGFYFLIKVHPELYESLQNPGNSPRHAESIFAAAFAEGLGILKDKFEDEEKWKTHHNLKSLNIEMKKKKVKAWDEDGFSANRAAAAFHPHIIDTGISADD